MATPFLALAVLALRLPAPLEVAEIGFSELVLHSDFVVRGEVVATYKVGFSGAIFEEGDEASESTLKIARIRVEEVLRGPADLETVWVHATPTFACDTSDATVGERALWLLDVRPDVSRFSMRARSASGTTTAYGALTGGAAMHNIINGGRGKMLLSEHEGAPWVTASDDVHPPAEGEFLGEAHEGKYRQLYWTAALAEVEAWVDSALRARGGYLPLHPETRAPATAAVVTDGRVVLASWSDGTLIWSEYDSMGGPPFWVERGDTLRWDSLNDWLRAWSSSRQELMAAADETVLAPASPGTVVTLRGSVCVSFAVDPNGASADDSLGANLLRGLLERVPTEGGAVESLEALEFEVFPRAGR